MSVDIETKHARMRAELDAAETSFEEKLKAKRERVEPTAVSAYSYEIRVSRLAEPPAEKTSSVKEYGSWDCCLDWWLKQLARL